MAKKENLVRQNLDHKTATAPFTTRLSELRIAAGGNVLSMERIRQQGPSSQDAR